MKTNSSFPRTTLKAHLAINVRNVDASVAFYRTMFGIEPMKVRPGYAKFDVENPKLNFTLNEHPFGEPGALSHLGIQVATTDDVLAIRDMWKGAGLEPVDEMNTSCCYAVQDKAWVADPDGNQWEVFTVLDDADAGNATCCATTSADGRTDRTVGAVAEAVAEPVGATAAACTPGSGCC